MRDWHLRLSSDSCVHTVAGTPMLTHMNTHRHTHTIKITHNSFYLQFVSSEAVCGDFNSEETSVSVMLGIAVIWIFSVP